MNTLGTCTITIDRLLSPQEQLKAVSSRLKGAESKLYKKHPKKNHLPASNLDCIKYTDNSIICKYNLYLVKTGEGR